MLLLPVRVAVFHAGTLLALHFDRLSFPLFHTDLPEPATWCFHPALRNAGKALAPPDWLPRQCLSRHHSAAARPQPDVRPSH